MSEANPLDHFVSVRRHLDLFSGIGGFALAAQWAGFETVAFCEIEEFPRKVLEKNFPGVPIHGDIRDLDGSEYAGIELVSGGYPCQPFSHAGKRKGKEDDRHLWPEMLRVITQARPTWVVAENVAGHITLGLDQVITDLEGEGYSARPIVVPAYGVNGLHSRNRVWIIATKTNSLDTDTNSHRLHREEMYLNRGTELRHEQISFSGSLVPHGIRDGTDPRVFGMVDGLPNRVDRIKGIGNAIVPQVAYEILRCLRAH